MKPTTANDVLDQFEELLPREVDAELTEGAKGALIGHLNQACGGDANRKLVLNFLTGHSSSKELKRYAWEQLRRWVDAQEIGGKWYPRNGLKEDCRVILEHVV